MIDYLLVHGGNVSTDTWNALVKKTVYPPGGRLGGRVWNTIVPILEKYGHRVFAPTLQDEDSCNLTGHVAATCSLITAQNLRDIILVGHSYGGMVITGVAARMGERIRRLVFVDAALPDPGESLLDIIVSAGYDPMSFAGLEAAPPYVEKLLFDPAAIEKIPKTYILCTESEFAAVTRCARRKIAVDRNEWRFWELPTSHIPMATMPEKLAQILLEAN